MFIAYIVLVGWSSLLQNFANRAFIIYLHAYIAASVAYLCKSWIVKGMMYTILFTLFLIEASLEVNFDLHISPSVLTLLAETTQQESMEFLHSIRYMPSIYIIPSLAILFCIQLIWAEKNRIKTSSVLKKGKVNITIRCISAFMLSMGCITSWCYVTLFQCQTTDEVSAWNLHMRHPSDALTRTAIAVFDLQLSKREMEKVIQLAENVNHIRPIHEDKLPLCIIFVIGESYIKCHASLYGYELNTTPNMLKEQKEGRLFAFTNAVSPYNLTTNVIRNLISCNSMTDGEKWNEYPPISAVFKKAGFHVTMYDNQKTFSRGATFTFAMNTFLYSPRMAAACYHETNDTTFAYDGQMVDYYKSTSMKTDQNQLTIYHLMGQHTQFDKRYPADDRRFKVFTADSINRNEEWLTMTKKQLIAHYDNATAYNDYTLNKIMQLYQKQNAILIYLADHGEEVYDYRDSTGRFGGDNLKQLLRFQYEVPFVIWCSDYYKQHHPYTIELIKQAINRPMMTDNTCQLLLYLGGMTNSPYYKDHRNVISPSYKCETRILDEQYNYDKIIKGNGEKSQNHDDTSRVK